MGTLRVVSWNVQEWIRYEGRLPSIVDAVDQLVDLGPTIVAIQEFPYKVNVDQAGADILLSTMGDRYPSYDFICHPLGPSAFHGNTVRTGLLSLIKRRILSSYENVFWRNPGWTLNDPEEIRSYDKGGTILRCRTGGLSWQCVNVHMFPLERFGFTDDLEVVNPTWREVLATIPHSMPFVVTGDFNINGTLLAALPSSNNRIAGTAVMDRPTTETLTSRDDVLFSEPFTLARHRILCGPDSDHCAVFAELSFS